CARANPAQLALVHARTRPSRRWCTPSSRTWPCTSADSAGRG
ncbi:MAG: hypothetical protein AVDCRST_MAG34-497, partial [uncultured Nocardioidaceae bacterium]